MGNWSSKSVAWKPARQVKDWSYLSSDCWKVVHSRIEYAGVGVRVERKEEEEEEEEDTIRGQVISKSFLLTKQRNFPLLEVFHG